MTAEDRTGRGGDHIPFREHGYVAMRFTSANENGNANVADTNYIDNQHTSRDILGYDTDADGVLDSLLVDFHYLARNAAINGNAAGMAAIGPRTPEFSISVDGNEVTVAIIADESYPGYRIGVRTGTFDWDSVYTFTSQDATLNLASGGTYFMSVASVDSNGVESLFSGEIAGTITAITEPNLKTGIQLLPAKPNPADESTMITVNVVKPIVYKSASIRVLDSNGNVIKELPIKLDKEINETIYHHGFNASGSYFYQLVIDAEVRETRKLLFTRH
jgi:hypothetical protein